MLLTIISTKSMGNCLCKPKTKEQEHAEEIKERRLDFLHHNPVVSALNTTIEKIDQAVNPIHHVEQQAFDDLATAAKYSTISIPMACGAVALTKHAIEAIVTDPTVTPEAKTILEFANANMLHVAVLGTAIGLFLAFKAMTVYGRR